MIPGRGRNDTSSIAHRDVPSKRAPPVSSQMVDFSPRFILGGSTRAEIFCYASSKYSIRPVLGWEWMLADPEGTPIPLSPAIIKDSEKSGKVLLEGRAKKNDALTQYSLPFVDPSAFLSSKVTKMGDGRRLLMICIHHPFGFVFQMSKTTTVEDCHTSCKDDWRDVKNGRYKLPRGRHQYILKGCSASAGDLLCHYHHGWIWPVENEIEYAKGTLDASLLITRRETVLPVANNEEMSELDYGFVEVPSKKPTESKSTQTTPIPTPKIRPTLRAALPDGFSLRMLETTLEAHRPTMYPSGHNGNMEEYSVARRFNGYWNIFGRLLEQVRKERAEEASQARRRG